VFLNFIPKETIAQLNECIEKFQKKMINLDFNYINDDSYEEISTDESKLINVIYTNKVCQFTFNCFYNETCYNASVYIY
jgi:hypothetical protein